MTATRAAVRIEGRGPVAMALALFLARQGFDAGSISMDPVPTELPLPLAARSLALSLGSWQLLSRVALLAPAAPISKVEVSLRGHAGRTRIQAADLNAPALGYVLRYGALHRALSAALDALGARVPAAPPRRRRPLVRSAADSDRRRRSRRRVPGARFQPDGTARRGGQRARRPRHRVRALHRRGAAGAAAAAAGAALRAGVVRASRAIRAARRARIQRIRRRTARRLRRRARIAAARRRTHAHAARAARTRSPGRRAADRDRQCGAGASSGGGPGPEPGPARRLRAGAATRRTARSAPAAGGRGAALRARATRRSHAHRRTHRHARASVHDSGDRRPRIACTRRARPRRAGAPTSSPKR